MGWITKDVCLPRFKTQSLPHSPAARRAQAEYSWASNTCSKLGVCLDMSSLKTNKLGLKNPTGIPACRCHLGRKPLLCSCFWRDLPPLSLFKVSDTQGRLGSTRKPERQVTKMVVIMILAFLICWSPYAAFSILVTTYPSIKLDPRLSAIPAFFSKTATVYNPVIYAFMNSQVLHTSSLGI